MLDEVIHQPARLRIMAFEGRKPRTLIALTTAGRAAFDAHVKALRELIGG